MARYTKRPDGRYMTHVTIGTREDGKPKRKTVYAKTIREFEEKTAEIRRQLASGAFASDGDITVSDWAKEWLDTYKSGVQYKTYSMYSLMVNKHIIPTLGQLYLKDVRPSHLQRLINEKVSSGLTRTVEHMTQTIKQIFTKAVENNLITKSPAVSLVTPKRNKVRKRVLTDREKVYISTADLDLKCKSFLMVLLYTGARRGEALALRKEDVDIKNKTVSINKTLLLKKGRPEIKPSPKSKAGNRIIDMPDVLVEILAQYVPTITGDYIFPTAGGGLMSDTAFRRFWSKILIRLNKAAGGGAKKIKDESTGKMKWIQIKMLAGDITPHMFRHTYATMLYYAGVDIKTAQYLLGHASVNVTMEIYTHLDMSKKKEEAKKLNSYISNSQKVVMETTDIEPQGG